MLEFKGINHINMILTTASLNAFICTIRTVLIPVTLPALRNTHVGAGTLECFWTASLCLWNRYSV